MKKSLLLMLFFFAGYINAATVYSMADQPDDLAMCTDTSTGCFDLTVNEAPVLVGLTPSDYVITYHTTLADANDGTNNITTPTVHCISPGTQVIYLRREAIAGGAFQVYDFSISVHTAFGNALTLNQMVQCDDDGDGFVAFNLVNGAYLLDDEILSFYPTMADALAQTNEITNPTSYPIAAGVDSDTNVIVRQEIVGDCDTLTALPIIALPSCNLGNMCDTANSLCSALGVPFQNAINIEEAQPFYYACLAQTPNPVWFYIPISAAGDLHLKIEQNASIDFTGNQLDADYIIFGPFSDPVTPCANGTLMGNNIDSCSNSIADIEYPTVENVQPGEFYLMMVINYFNMPGYIRITEMPTSTAEIDCSGITMTAFLDSNANGVKDSGEQNFPLGAFNYTVNDDPEMNWVISPTGTHNIYDTEAANSYDISFAIDSDYTGNYSLTTASFTDVSIPTGGGMTEYFFPVTALGSFSDLAVAIISEAPPMPGFEYVNKIIYTNFGSAPVATGTVTFMKDPLLTIISTSEPGAVINANGFTFDFVNLLPFETRELTVTMQVPTIPTVQLGDSLSSTAEITPIDGDSVPLNNSFFISEKNIGSYDPNDKMEAHGGQILYSGFTADDYLYYTIRFENTGTAPAINIRVVDELAESLDETSIQMVSASHNYTLERIDSQLTWRFDNVLLPPTMDAPEESHGYITFKVKPEPGYEIGDIIPNTASIYFDFNPAIVTNTFNTEFVAALAVAGFDNFSFSISPNPTNGFVTITAYESDAQMEVTVYDILGKAILTRSGGTNSLALDLSSVSKGIYIVKARIDGNRTSMKKLIVN